MDRTKMREEIHSILRRCIKVDATGLAPAVIGHHIFGFDDVVDAILPLLTTAEGEDQGAPCGTGSRPSDQTPSGFDASRVDPLRKLAVPELYKIHKGYEWAHIFLDEGTGTFAAVSSYGNFAHIWMHRGNESLKEFLRGLEYDYFMGKTAPSKGRQFSAEETIKGIKETILDCRRQGSIVLSKEDARAAWEDLDALDTMGSNDHFFHELTESSAIMKALDNDYYDVARNEDDPQCRGFWTKIWPEFLAAIRRVSDVQPLAENPKGSSAEHASAVPEGQTPEYLQGFREGIEKAAKMAELYAEENLTMAGDTILADPVIRGRDFSDAAMKKSETLRIMGHGHSAAYHAGTDIAAHIRSLKDQGERG